MILTLTQEERDKFAAWLEQEAKTDHEMANQMKTFGGNAMEAGAQKYNTEAMAKEIVAKVLRSIETETMTR